MKGTKSLGVIALAVVGLFVTLALQQERVQAQGRTGGAEPKAEEVFKNITSLKGAPAEHVNPTMVFFEAALGVGCPYCHDNDATKRDLDTKPQKFIARQMIEMVNTINKNSFNGASKVTCFTCHMGRSTPLGTPNVTGVELPPALGEDYLASLPPTPAPPAISPAQLLDRYVAALGGPKALQQVPSLMAMGTVTQRRPGRNFPANQIEFYTKAPGMELTVTHVGQNENLMAYGTRDAWAKAGAAAPRDLRKAELDATRLEDVFNLPVQLTQMLLDPQVGRPEVVDGRELYVLTGHTQNLPMLKAYFEKETGMLARLVYFIDTPFGAYPTQITYGDFRDVGGRKVPYTWVIAQTRNREFTYTMQTVRPGPIEDAKFARPATVAR